VSKLRFSIAMSLDGFTAGPNQSVDDPLGVGGMRLHEWVFPLAVWRATRGPTRSFSRRQRSSSRPAGPSTGDHPEWKTES